MKQLKIGDRAPDFKLENQDGKIVSLADFKKNWIILYFYPRDNTPGCTIEAVDFSKELNELKKMKAVVLGVSPDTVESHKKFIKNKKLKVELLSDTKHIAMDKYNSWGKKKFMGREYMGVIRSTFLINDKGKIAYIWPNVRAAGHAANVKEKLKELS
jgi:thioredoxin-dependent peroxiredoxin